MMIYLWVTGALAMIAAICGLVAGNAANRATLRHNLSVLAVISAGLVFILLVTALCFERDVRWMIWSWALEKYERFGYFSGFRCDSTPGKFSDLEVLGMAGFCAFGVVAVGLTAFNCRQTVKSLGISILGVIAGGALLYFGSIYAFNGLDAWIVLCRRFDHDYPGSIVILAMLLLTAVLLGWWTYYSFFGKRRGWRVLLAQLGIWSGCYFLCWLSALAAAAGYGCVVIQLAAKQGIAACFVQRDELPEVSAQTDKIYNFEKQYPLFKLPVYSDYNWLTQPSDHNGNLIPSDARQYTLNNFNSQPALDYYQSFENIINAAVNPVDPVDPNTGFRIYPGCLAYVCAGRAVLYRETGEIDKILPQLMKIMEYDRQKFAGQPFADSEKVRITCLNYWFKYLIIIGPDGAPYAPVYRQALDYLNTQKLYLPNEAAVLIDKFENIKIKCYADFLTLPGNLAFAAKGISYFMSIRPELKKLETDGYHGEVLPWDHLDIYRDLAIKSEVSLLLGRTGVALKLYRSLEGKYPAALAELVPKYLDQLPVSPLPESPLIYQLDGNDFSLSIKEPSSKYPYKITTEKQY